MKSYRIDIHKGINVIGDKAVIPEGFLSVADGVDLRSGMPRPFYMPMFDHAATAGSKCLFEFKDQWFYSTDYREYAAEYLNGHSMVYWTGEGITPQLWVDGAQADLGPIVPTATPTVASTSNLRTQLIGGNINTSGNYKGGEVISYRVAPRTKYGVMPPSNKWSITMATQQVGIPSGRAGYISWTTNVEGVLGWQIFIGPDNEEQFYVELGPTATNYTDNGVGVGNGPLASSYIAQNPYTYIYTFVRDVNGIMDESGPSYPSNSVEAQAGRLVSIDTLNDGYWSQDGSQSVALTFMTTEDEFPESTFSWGGWNSVSGLYKVICDANHGLSTGDFVHFGGSTNAATPDKDLEVVIDVNDPKVFYINTTIGWSMAGHILTAPTWFRPLKTRIVDATQAISDGDYIKISGTVSSVPTVFGVYKATASATPGRYYINLYTDNANWSSTKAITGGIFYSHNKYYKYRNLYRTGDSSGYQLVTQLDLSETQYSDAVSVQYLGGQPDSYYTEIGSSGVPQIISYLPPPKGMRSIVSHYGMNFGIDGHTVRWTPPGRPSAWPATYTLSFPFEPVRIIPYSQSLIVLCLDAIYRIDGNAPGALSCMITQAKDGCIAPNSVQIVNNTLIYLSRRGIMAFDGHKAECLTDSRITPLFWQGTSYDATSPFWIKPSLATYNYANLAMRDGIQGANDDSYNLYGTLALGTRIDAIRSFVQYGKYFIYWALPYNNYSAHTMLCIDLQAADAPITSLPLKPYDAHTSANGIAYILIDNDEASAKTVRSSIAEMSDTASISPTSSAAVFKFNEDRTIRIPFHIRTGANALGLPMVRKRFSSIRVHGSDPTGTYRLRVFIDDRYVCDGRVVTVTNPNKIRQANIPVGSCVGYTIDVELSGDSHPRALEFLYDYIASEVDSGKS